MSVRRCSIVIEKTGAGFSAYSPDVDGCISVGDAERQTRSNLREALAADFEGMRELGEPLPEPRSSVDHVEVAA
jgi:predicted RNase H-like HicB family nuclease